MVSRFLAVAFGVGLLLFLLAMRLSVAQNSGDFHLGSETLPEVELDRPACNLGDPSCLWWVYGNTFATTRDTTVGVVFRAESSGPISSRMHCFHAGCNDASSMFNDSSDNFNETGELYCAAGYYGGFGPADICNQLAPEAYVLHLGNNFPFDAGEYLAGGFKTGGNVASDAYLRVWDIHFIYEGPPADPPPTTRGFENLNASFYNATDLNDFAFSLWWADPIDFLLPCRGETSPYEGCELHPELADGADYSVRWEGELIVPVTGHYTFIALSSDDGVRIVLDDAEILDQGWRYPQPDLRPSPQTVFLTAGSHHVVIDYEQRVPFVASLQLRWSGPSFAEEVIPNLTAPPDVTRLIRYGFDEDQIYEQEVENRVVGSIDWMKGRVSGDPEPVTGASGAPNDLALLFNVPEDAAIDFVEVSRGKYLTFSQGILFASKIYLEEAPSKPAMIIASQVDETEEIATTPWRVSLDRWVLQGKLTVTFLLTFEGGKVSLVYHELSDPTAYLGRWIDVAASYNPETGTQALLWDGSWVETQDVGPAILASGPAPIRIAKAFAAGTLAFEGGIDEVEIWGDSPACHQLTTLTELKNEEGEIEPNAGGIVLRNPEESQLPEFCADDSRYAVGEKVSLEAEASGRNAFYQWKGGIEYLQGSEEHKYDISLTLLDDTTATAQFFERGTYPRMRRFPVDRQHNTGYDDKTCDEEPCAYGCGLEAKALANSDCHFGGVDIFAPMKPKDPTDPWPDENQAYVVNAQRGQVVFYCDYDAKKQELVGGNSAMVYVPNRRNPDYVYYYAHMDQVCSTKGTNLCTEELLKSECPGCEPHEPETEDLRCWRTYRDLTFVRPGRRLGAVGKSGNAIDKTPHLHFTVFDVIAPENWRASCEELDPFAFLYPLEERTRCRSAR